MTQQPAQPTFNPAFPHHLKPRLRGVRGFPVQAKSPDGKEMTLLGLADAQQISEKQVLLMPAAQVILPLMDGTRTLDDIAAQVGRGLSRQFLEPMVAQLDDAGLIEGPAFDALLARVHQEFDSAPILPPSGSADFADMLVTQKFGDKADEQQKAEHGPRLVREVFDQWIAKALENAQNPSIDRLPAAIVAPHLDYGRGWINYASTYGRLRVCDRPDRVIILGTNHFGRSTGVCGCDKGYRTPLGECAPDTAVMASLRSSIGDRLFEHRFDHEREHSIELQIMWIQHIFGKDDAGNYPTVFGALIHDPCVNNGESYDGRGVNHADFAAALRATLASLPGRTLIVASADLSHVGPAFGDKLPLAGDAPEPTAERNRVFAHDQELLKMLVDRRPDDLVSSMAWQQNPTRWCSIGNLVATFKVIEPTKVDLLNYSAALDQQGLTMVSSAAMILSR